MIFNEIEKILHLNFPVIIVGSGPAGISLALRLEQKKIKSLIIEAGPEDYSEESQKFYKSKIIGDEITDLQFSRLRQFGGTSNQWGGWSKPMENYNLSDWGINISKLKQYTNMTCEILDIKNQFRKSVLDENFNQIEFQYSSVNFKNKYKKHIGNSKFINLILNTQVINFSGKNKIIEYAVCRTNKKTYKIKSKKFVLAAGGIENSRILLWTRKNTNLIDDRLPIGKYWMTHPWFIGGHGILKKEDLSKYLKSKFIDDDGPLHISSSEKFKSRNSLSGSIYMSPLENEKLYKEVIKDVLCIAPEFGKKIARMVFKKDLKCGNIFLHFEESADKNNMITLDENIRDDNEVPITNLFYKKSNKTILVAKKLLESFAETCRTLDIGRVAIKDDIYEKKNYESLGVYHHLGGTRVGKDLNKSVVDKNLKVHNNENLFVTGSSVFSSAGYTNPTFTIVQLSLKLGDYISNNIVKI